ncbi:butyrate kinase, partial [bacterium]|nr:butyrate kinase [bacterium]
DLREVEARIEEGDEKAALIRDAMVYQIAKEMGAMAAALGGNLDGVVLTGGLVKSEKLLQDIRTKIEFLGEIFVFAGEEEMLALAEGALRVLRGEETAKRYGESA